MAPLLAIRADADSAIGLGHVMRCLALAQAWQDRGADAVFFCASIPDAIRQRLNAEGFRSVLIQAQPGSDEDARQTCRELSQSGGRLLAVDGERFRHRWQKQVKETGLRLLFMEDNGTPPPYCADWVWNADLPVRPQLYNNAGTNAKLLLGPEYALLRREFLRRQPKTKVASPVHNFLITMGGSDPENFTARTLRSLGQVRLSNWKVRIIIGAANPHLENIKAAVVGINAELLPPTYNMAEHMVWADTAFTVEGGTLWELLYMGVPVICWSRSELPSILLTELNCRGAAIALGCKTKAADLAAIVERLIKDSVRLDALRERSRIIVDGKGAERVVDELLRGFSG